MLINPVDTNPQEILPEIKSAINSVVDSGRFVSGDRVEVFEKEFADYCGRSYAVCVNSGTSALHLALLTSGIGRGDEVILPPNTFIATAEAVAYTGAKPVFVDIDIDTYNIDPDKIDRAIGLRTKAIIPVHMFGRPANMAAIYELTDRRGIKIIEDCCQSHGARYHDKKAPFSGTGCFSFYPSKNLGAFGEGGCIVTDNKETAELARQLRDHGQTEKGVHEYIGYNYRMDEIQAAVLSVKLKYLDEWNDIRRQVALGYNKLLSGIVTIPEVFHVNHQYIIRTPFRDELFAHLKSKGMPVGIHYPIPIHLQEAYKGKYGDFPVAEEVAKTMISLPIHPSMTPEQVVYIASMIKEFLCDLQ